MFQAIRLIKDLLLILYYCPSIIVPWEVVIVDIPPIFGMCLSCDFTNKIGGYMSLDWFHLIVRTRYGSKLKVLSKPLHLEYILDDNMMNLEPTHTTFSQNQMYCVEILEKEKVMGDRIEKEEVLLNEFIKNNPSGNYHATGLWRYIICDED